MKTRLYIFMGDSFSFGDPKWVAARLCAEHGKGESIYNEHHATKEAKAWHQRRRDAGLE